MEPTTSLPCWLSGETPSGSRPWISSARNAYWVNVIPRITSPRRSEDFPCTEPVTRVIATHLGLSPGERRHQVKRLLEVASHDDEGVTVLLGDINEWFVAGRPLRWLHARFGHGPSVRSWPAAMPMFKLGESVPLVISPTRLPPLRTG